MNSKFAVDPIRFTSTTTKPFGDWVRWRTRPMPVHGGKARVGMFVVSSMTASSRYTAAEAGRAEPTRSQQMTSPAIHDLPSTIRADRRFGRNVAVGGIRMVDVRVSSFWRDV
jgi:hypothetical protein